VDELVLALIPFGVLAALVVGTVRIAGRKTGQGRLSGAAGNALSEINAMLQPQQPTAEEVQKARENEDDEADDEDPPEAIALGGGDYPDDGLRPPGA
jgi:hypothetical protein